MAHALGTHLDLFQRIVISTCSISAIGWSPGRAGGAHRQLDRRPAHRPAAELRSIDERVLRVRRGRRFTTGASASPARASSSSRPAPAASVSRVKCEKQQVAAIAQYLRRCSATSRRPRTGRCRRRRAHRAGRAGVRARPDRPRLRPRQRPPPGPARGDRRRRARRGGRDDEDRSSRRRETAATSGSTSPAARPPRSATTPTASSPPAGRLPLVQQPDRPRRPPVPADELSPSGGPDRRRWPILVVAPRSASTAACRGAATPRSSSTSSSEDGPQQAIYKPVRGERPLWDFEPGLHRREVAAYLLSEPLGHRRRAADRDPRRARSARARSSGSSTPTTASTTSRSTSSTRPARPAARRSPCSTSSPTTPTARAGTACSPTGDRRRVGDRQRAVLRRRVQAAHGDLGVRRRADRRRPCSPPVAGSRRARAARHRRAVSPTTRSTRCSAGRRGCAEHGSCPADESGRRYPWPLV